MSSDLEASASDSSHKVIANELTACADIVVTDYADDAVDALRKLYRQRADLTRVPLRRLFNKSPHLAMLMAMEVGRHLLVQRLIEANKLNKKDIKHFSIF